VIEESRAMALCGEYTASGGLIEQLRFTGSHDVTVRVAGIETSKHYHVRGKKIFIRLDTDILVLERHGQAALAGKLEGLQSDNVHLAKKSEMVAQSAKCDPYPADGAEKTRLAHELCYRDGVDLQRTDPASAEAHYLACCESGGAISCNKYGLLKYGLGDPKTGRDFFQRACDGGFGAGCTNLADIEYRAGRKRAALALYKRACDAGHRVACSKADPSLIDGLSD
jgi:hypothetical protein